MKTVTELGHWLDGVEAQLGDPSAATGLLFARYQALKAPSDDVVIRFEDGALRLEAEGEIPIAIDPDGYVMRGEQLIAFGIEKVCDGVWSLNPSLNIPDVLHVFVVIYDVPTPAPWEKRIILT